ncbi:MAG TPA: amidohydrolase family protein [Opitutaceae bacterium]|jgi:predicted TIM-barrel fold metal-dependent hydrolase|nr:amidohydrolase family protein [Opitutaceae bacterium]
MKNRREFLQFGAAVASAAVLLPRRTDAQSDAPAATAAPSETGLLDLHNHWISPGAYEILSTRTAGIRYVQDENGTRRLIHPGQPAAAQPRFRGPHGTQMFDGPEVRLRHLDAHGVRRQLISWPTTSNVDPALTAEEARLLWGTYNDELAAVIAKYPERFSGVAALSTLDIEWSAQELARAHDKLGLIGGVLPANGFDTREGAEAFAPLFAVAQRHKSHIYLHTGYANARIPGQPPLPAHRDSLPARAALDNIWNFTAATITLAFSGFLDRYPDVTVQVAQLGGAGGIALVAEAVQQAADRYGPVDLKARFERIYLDTGAAGRGPEAIALATRVFGAERVLFGTDYGAAASVVPVIANLNRSPITPEDRRKIFRDNARDLLAAKGVAV